MFNFLKTTAETGIIVPVIVYNKIGWVLNVCFECVSDDFAQTSRRVWDFWPKHVAVEKNPVVFDGPLKVWFWNT